jgi:RHS repeat-associated protein
VRRLRDATGADLGGYRYTAFAAGFPPDAETPAASVDQPFRWKGRWFEGVAGGAYDVRARWWSPVTGTFLNLDEYEYHDPISSLWGWAGQNPARLRDPTGRDAGDCAIALGQEAIICFGAGVDPWLIPACFAAEQNAAQQCGGGSATCQDQQAQAQPNETCLRVGSSGCTGKQPNRTGTCTFSCSFGKVTTTVQCAPNESAPKCPDSIER